jgi:hypothetical protein
MYRIGSVMYRTVPYRTVDKPSNFTVTVRYRTIQYRYRTGMYNRQTEYRTVQVQVPYGARLVRI